MKILTAMALLVVALSSCNGYEDGPAISFRSKYDRILFKRPITLYTVNGVDSLTRLMDTLRTNYPGFRGTFGFNYDGQEYSQFINWSDSLLQFGFWTDQNGDLSSITLDIEGGRLFPICCWDVLRLTHRQLWLRNVSGNITRELRFEEK